MGVYLKQKRVTVTTSGTRVQLDATLKSPSITITADPESLELTPPHQFGTEEQLDCSKIYIDATANGDAVILSWYEREGSS